MNQGNNFLLFDGFCVLCSYFVRKLIKRYGDSLQLLPAQSSKGQELLKEMGFPAQLPNEVILFYNNQVYTGPSAIIVLMRNGGGLWKYTGKLADCMPRFFTKWLYRLIARYRYVIFGRRTSCFLG